MAVLVLAGRAAATHDTDGDLIPEEQDNCPGVFNPTQTDNDGDGRGNDCDDTPGMDGNSKSYVVYFRDQDGRQTPCVTIRWTMWAPGGGVWNTEEVCSQGGVMISSTNEDWVFEIEQLAPPRGCTGGLTESLRLSVPADVWRPVTVRFRCATSGPAPPVQTFTDTFAVAGQVKPHAVKVTAATPVAVLTVKWKDRRDRIDITGIQNVRRTVSAVEQEAPVKLKITRKRTATSMTVRIEKLKPGDLKFKVVAKVVKARATVVTSVSRRAR